MARGRQQKWICLDCSREFSIQGEKPNMCCSCGSTNLGRAPSYELAVNFEVKKKELADIRNELNETYARFKRLKAEYDNLVAYWRQQYRRGYITKDELDLQINMFDGASEKDDNTEYLEHNIDNR